MQVRLSAVVTHWSLGKRSLNQTHFKHETKAYFLVLGESATAELDQGHQTQGKLVLATRSFQIKFLQISNADLETKC